VPEGRQGRVPSTPARAAQRTCPRVACPVTHPASGASTATGRAPGATRFTSASRPPPAGSARASGLAPPSPPRARRILRPTVRSAGDPVLAGQRPTRARRAPTRVRTASAHSPPAELPTSRRSGAATIRVRAAQVRPPGSARHARRLRGWLSATMGRAPEGSRRSAKTGGGRSGLPLAPDELAPPLTLNRWQGVAGTRRF
jgi:hypothetical protein